MVTFDYDQGWPTTTYTVTYTITTSLFTNATQFYPAGEPWDRETREFLAALDRAKKRRIALPVEPWSPSASEERRPRLPRVLPPRIMRIQARGA